MSSNWSADEDVEEYALPQLTSDRPSVSALVTLLLPGAFLVACAVAALLLTR